MSGTGNTVRPPEYNTWASMIDRCTNPRNKQYADYGGRGITICERWRNSFPDFLSDMGRRSEGLSLDRINNEGNYEPGNCRWATRAEQNNNKRLRKTQPLLNLDGKTLTVKEAMQLSGLKKSTLLHRLRQCWPAEKIISVPCGALQGHRKAYTRWNQTIAA